MVEATASPGTLESVLAESHLVFVDTSDPFHKRVGVASLSAPESDRYRTGLVCDRVYFAAGEGMCSGSEEHYYDLGTLEAFTVYKDGAVFQSPSFNFWGTTFARDGKSFYATLGDGSVGAQTYLVKGECPSLSPDETRIVFKKRIQGPSIWRLAHRHGSQYGYLGGERARRRSSAHVSGQRDLSGCRPLTAPGAVRQYEPAAKAVRAA